MLVSCLVYLMDRRRRLSILAEAAMADREDGLRARAVGTRPVRLPGGGQTTIMRVMQTNVCSLACAYCPLHRGARVPRVTLAPEEVATTFMDAQRAGLAQGLFLTSGVPGSGVRGVDRMLETLDILRRRERFGGYIHVKLLPGVQAAQVEQATRLANRVSINLEGPDDRHVRALARDKDLTGDLLPRLEQAGRLYRTAALEGRPGTRRSAGTTTQFVVGGAAERDREILGLVQRLERERLLHHAHFSAFQPVAATPMDGRRPTPYVRELRLYQAEHLMRGYGFRLEELVFEANGDLPLEQDPKMVWAVAHPEHFPLEVMTTSYERLLRVPGIGPATARTIVAERRRVTLRGATDLGKLGVDTARAGHFLALRGRRVVPALPAQQLRLFRHEDWFRDAPWKTAVPPCAFR
jgi:predicted DNA-binding helix-hairpin-helix protein